jgi:hypothetical protein
MSDVTACFISTAVESVCRVANTEICAKFVGIDVRL